MMLCLRKGAKGTIFLCIFHYFLFFYRFYKGIQCNRCGGITGKERVRFSAGELWTTDYNGIIGFGRGIGKQHPGYQIVVVSVLKTIYEERKGKLKRI